MKKCNIYKTPTEYIVETYSETDIGLYISDDPVFIIALNDEIGLQKALFDSLSNSKKDIPTPKRDEWTKWQKERLKKINQKSFNSLYEKSNSCNAILENGILKIYPEKYRISGKPSEGLVHVEEDKVEIADAENKKEEVTSSIIEILSRKYR